MPREMRPRKRKCGPVECSPSKKLHPPHCGVDRLPNEILNRIFSFLPIQDLFSLRCVNSRFLDVVTFHMESNKTLSFSRNSQPWQEARGRVNDRNIAAIFSKFQNVESLEGFAFDKVNFQRLTRSRAATQPLSYRGIIWAFKTMRNLKRVSTNDTALASYIMCTFPNVFVELRFNGNVKTLPCPTSIPKMIRTNKFWLVNQRLPASPIRSDEVESILLENVSLKGRASAVHNFDLECPRLLDFSLRRNLYNQQSTLFTYKVACSLSRCVHLRTLELADIHCTPGQVEAAVLDAVRDGFSPFSSLETLTISNCDAFNINDVIRILYASQNSLRILRLDPIFCTSALFRILRVSKAIFPHLESIELGYTGHNSSPWECSYDSFCRIDDSDIARLYEVFPNMRDLSIRGCPFLRDATSWAGNPANAPWSRLQSLDVSFCGVLCPEKLVEFVNSNCKSGLKALSLHCLSPVEESIQGDEACCRQGALDRERTPPLSDPRLSQKSPYETTAKLSVDVDSHCQQVQTYGTFKMNFHLENLSSLSLISSSATHLHVTSPVFTTLLVGHCTLLQSLVVKTDCSVEVTIAEGANIDPECFQQLPSGSIVLSSINSRLQAPVEGLEMVRYLEVDGAAKLSLRTEVLPNLRARIQRDQSFLRSVDRDGPKSGRKRAEDVSLIVAPLEAIV